MSGPPFRSLDSALYWAFEVVSKDICDISSIYRRRERDRAHEPDLDVWERHGQAGAILGMVETYLERDHQVYVLARYAKVKVAIDEVQHWMAARLGTGVHNRQAIQKCWLGHCGMVIGRAALAKDLGYSSSQWRPAVEFRRKMNDALSPVYQGMCQRLEPPMVAKRIVEFAYYDRVDRDAGVDAADTPHRY